MYSHPTAPTSTYFLLASSSRSGKKLFARNQSCWYSDTVVFNSCFVAKFGALSYNPQSTYYKLLYESLAGGLQRNGGQKHHKTGSCIALMFLFRAICLLKPSNFYQNKHSHLIVVRVHDGLRFHRGNAYVPATPPRSGLHETAFGPGGKINHENTSLTLV